MSRIPKRAILKKVISFPTFTVRVYYDAKTSTWFRRTNTNPDNAMEMPEEINSTTEPWVGRYWEVMRGQSIKTNKIYGNDSI